MKTPRALDLPYSSWRTGQRKAIRAALHSRRRHVVLQAPTGQGKSLIAAALHKLDPVHRTPILTATNALLSQYASTFSHLMPIKGARNYPCLAARDELRRYFRFVRPAHDVMCDDGPCRSNVRCTLREDGCLYYDALRSAMASRAPLTNYAYWLAMRRYSNGMGVADRLVVDEAHSLPDELMKAYRIDLHRHETRGYRGTSIRAWKEWAAVQQKHMTGEDVDDDHRVRSQRVRDKYSQLLTMDSDTWAFDRTHDGYTFEPVVPRLLFPLLADDTTNMVYMSATITPSMLQLMDVPDDDIEFLSLPSTFPVNRRPIYLVKTARVQHNMSADDRTYWHAKIDRVIQHRLDRKGIIHAVSYERQREIVRRSRYRQYMIAPRADQLEQAVRDFRLAGAGTILVSPSVEQGFDFPYTDCEYVIIPKMPFPDTRSNIMKARITATPLYRDYHTMTRLQQAAGRHVRADDDAGETFILDDHARWFVDKHRALASESFLAAIQYVSHVPLPPPPLAFAA